MDGIPYYIIVDREGNAAGRPDLRDHSLYVKTVLEKLGLISEECILKRACLSGEGRPAFLRSYVFVRMLR